MKKALENIREMAFVKLPPALREPFRLDCAQRNNFRFVFLPYLNIFTQIACYFIYVHIYPAAYPEKPSLDAGQYIALSVFYISINIAFAVALYQICKRADSPNYVRNSHRLIIVYLIAYIFLESVETVMEVEISGNIYRFLATFFMVSFLPILSQLEKSLLLLSYTVLIEIGFSRLSPAGHAASSRYAEIVIVFFLVCLVMSNVVYSNAVRSFLLKHELVEANKKLQYLTITDPLTNIANRRAFNDYVRIIWDACKRNGHSINAFMVDIDWFKKYNDHYGHQKGDECLVQVATFLKDYFNRSIDMVARYGGEEFIILLPYTSQEGVAKLAEGIRKGVEDLRIRNEQAGPGRCITISVGVASMVPEMHDHYEKLIKMADDALYLAKANGRNRVCYANLAEDQKAE